MQGIHLNGAELSYGLLKFALCDLEQERIGADLDNLTLIVADQNSIIPLTDTYITTETEIYYIPYVLPDEEFMQYLLSKIPEVVHKIQVTYDSAIESDVAIIVHDKGIYRFTA